jgi:NTP pyrophosphatase (non-canonical NTP hydrolase)
MKEKNITEHRAIKLFSKKFGTDFMTRLDKFNEEVSELNEAIKIYNTLKDDRPEIVYEMLEHIDDEFSDVQGTFTHLASLRQLFQREMLDNCIDKVIKRETNPEYKRF